MTEHEGLARLIVLGISVWIIIGGAGLVILGLQLREARRETVRLFTATAGMVHQEAEKLMQAVTRAR